MRLVAALCYFCCQSQAALLTGAIDFSKMPEGWLPTASPLLLQKMHGTVLRRKGDSNPKHRDSTCSLKRNFPKACRKRGVLVGKTSKRWKHKLSVFWFLQRVKRKRNFKQWSAEIWFCLIYRLEKTTCILLKALFPVEIRTNRRGADPQIPCLSLSLIHSCLIISLASSTALHKYFHARKPGVFRTEMPRYIFYEGP